MEYTLAAVDEHSHSPLDLAQYLIDEGFLNTLDYCWECGYEMHLEYFNRSSDGVVWRCRNNACRWASTVRRGSFFAASKFPLLTQIRLIIQFVANSTVSSTARVLDAARSAVTEYFIDCRRMYAAELENDPISFTGTGEYEVDELQILRVEVTPNVFADIWVQSILERRTGRIFLHRIDNRSRPQMVPQIQRLVPATSVVFSDEHKSYENLRTLGYYHATVNHSAKEYQRWGIVAGMRRDIHINTCEGVNGLIRRRLAYKTRRNLEYIDLVLAEIMYRRSGRSLFDPFK